MVRLRIALFLTAGLLASAGLALLVLAPSSEGHGPEGEGPALLSGSSLELPREAPDFSLTLLDGSRFSLADHLAGDGRPVVLNFWASWCLPCREEMPTLDQAADRHPDLLFLGVAVEDDPQAARDFAEEVDVGYPLGVDESGTVGARYPYFGLPTTYFIDAQGRIVFQINGLVTPDLLDSLLEQHLG